MIVILNIISFFSKIARFNPIILSGGTFDLLNAQKNVEDFMPAMGICASAIVLLVALSVVIFNKKEI